MADGQLLKAYMRANKINKTKLATDLSITRQGLYVLFKSKEMEPETKKAIEKALKVKWSDLEKFIDDNIDDIVSRETNRSASNFNDVNFRDKYIASLERENLRLQRSVEANLNELDQRTKVIAEIQTAMLQILLVQSSDRKAVYNKTVEILKRYKLEGSFL